jgi:protein-S-isoprenylcysteine O-methyltransferase Ste14
MSARIYVALRSVLVSNAVLLLVVAVLLARFMEWPAGVIGAAVACVLAGMSLGAARWTDRVYEQRR